MVSAPNGTSLNQELRALAEINFPDRPQYGYEFYLHVVLAVQTIEDTEHTTPLTIHKFCYELLQQNVSVFAPFSVYLGGRYHPLIASELDELVAAGILTSRPSEEVNGDVPVYQVAPTYRNDRSTPSIWSEIYDDFEEEYNLGDLFERHENKEIYPWITEDENYIGVDQRELDNVKSNLNKYDHRVAEKAAKVDSLPPAVADMSQENKAAGYLSWLLVKYFKQIPTKSGDHYDPDFTKACRRKFDISKQQSHAKELDTVVNGDLVFDVGFFDLAEQENRNQFSDVLRIKEHPRSETSLPVDYNGSLNIPESDLYDYGIGILARVKQLEGDTRLQAIALLRSSKLGEQLLAHQDRHRMRRIDRTHRRLREEQAEQMELITRQVRLLQAIEDLRDKRNLDPETQSKVDDLLSRARKHVGDAMMIDFLIEQANEHPEVASLITEGISYITP